MSLNDTNHLKGLKRSDLADPDTGWDAPLSVSALRIPEFLEEPRPKKEDPGDTDPYSAGSGPELTEAEFSRLALEKESPG